MSYFKTIMNAWTTTYRMHEPTLLCCLFGCLAPDSLAHYACCPHLYFLVVSALGGPLPVPAPQARAFFALPPPIPNPVGIYRVFVSFTTYHFVRCNFFPHSIPHSLPQQKRQSRNSLA